MFEPFLELFYFDLRCIYLDNPAVFEIEIPFLVEYYKILQQNQLQFLQPITLNYFLLPQPGKKSKSSRCVIPRCIVQIATVNNHEHKFMILLLNKLLKAHPLEFLIQNCKLRKYLLTYCRLLYEVGK